MSAFINNMFDFTSDYYQDYPYNIEVGFYSKDAEKDEKAITSVENIDEYFYVYRTRNYLEITDMEKVREKEMVYENEETNEKSIGMEIYGLDSASFKKYVKTLGLNYNKVKNKGILVDNYMIERQDTFEETRIYNYQEGDKIKGIFNAKQTEIEIEVGSVTDKRPYGIENSFYHGGFLVVDESEFKNLEIPLSQILIQSKVPDKVTEDIEKLNDENVHVWNMEDEMKEEKAMVLVIKIFLYGFISVITLIGVTNIFNTITSNMELRQKEFAMLKSIGMTKKEFNRMINLETIFYGTKSLIYGMILGGLGTFALYLAFDIKMDSFYLPIEPAVISVFAVFILIFVIMKYSIGKINRQNTIETIRKDNI